MSAKRIARACTATSCATWAGTTTTPSSSAPTMSPGLTYAAARDGCLRLDGLDAAGDDGASSVSSDDRAPLRRHLRRVTAVAVGDDAHGAAEDRAHGVLRAPEAHLGAAARIHDDDVTRLQIRGKLSMLRLGEPAAVRSHDVFRGLQLPHRLVARHTANRRRLAPELHAGP